VGLFVCDECGMVENTALSHYWLRNVHGDGRALCSACDPEIGHWHGKFPRHQWDGKQEVKNRESA
jgi:hypothetical protein